MSCDCHLSIRWQTFLIMFHSTVSSLYPTLQWEHINKHEDSFYIVKTQQRIQYSLLVCKCPDPNNFELKTFTIAFYLFSIYFFYIYTHCRKFNTEFNNLIKTIGHSARFFPEKWCWTYPPLPFWLFDSWIYSHCYLSSPKVVTKH